MTALHLARNLLLAAAMLAGLDRLTRGCFPSLLENRIYCRARNPRQLMNFHLGKTSVIGGTDNVIALVVILTPAAQCTFLDSPGVASHVHYCTPFGASAQVRAGYNGGMDRAAAVTATMGVVSPYAHCRGFSVKERCE